MTSGRALIDGCFCVKDLRLVKIFYHQLNGDVDKISLGTKRIFYNFLRQRWPINCRNPLLTLKTKKMSKTLFDFEGKNAVKNFCDGVKKLSSSFVQLLTNALNDQQKNCGFYFLSIKAVKR